MDEVEKNTQLKLELTPEIAQGEYANLAIISHSSSDFILDFARILPGLEKSQVRSRVILAPEHAKRLLYALQENVAKFEADFGTIRLPEQNISKAAPFSFEKSDA